MSAGFECEVVVGKLLDDPDPLPPKISCKGRAHRKWNMLGKKASMRIAKNTRVVVEDITGGFAVPGRWGDGDDPSRAVSFDCCDGMPYDEQISSSATDHRWVRLDGSRCMVFLYYTGSLGWGVLV